MSKRIFILGSGPLPNEKEGIREAAGLRTEQFIRPLQKAGHTIKLVIITNKKPQEEKGESKGISFLRIHRHDKKLISAIKKEIKEYDPELCIGVNTFPAFVMSTCTPDHCPFWADLNGWIMAEAQARSWSENSNDIFANAWRQEKSILKKADKISTVSENQKFAIIGELASLGILRKENFLEEKVFSIPNATKFFDIDKISKKIIHEALPKTPYHNVDNNNDKVDITDDNSTCIQKLFKGKKVPENAFIIAWIGGYNNWVDEQTLFDTVSAAMSKDDNVYFVSTGGAIKNIANDTFGRFRQMIDKCQFKDRFIFLGWIETEDMRKIYDEADIGINVDYRCIETETGARNRINEMLKFGLPVITTGGSEIAEVIGKEKAGITVENGNSDILTDAILSMSKMSKKERIIFGTNGQYISEEIFTDTKTLTPLLQYAQNPIKTQLPPLPIHSSIMYIKNIWWYMKKNTWKTIWGKLVQKVSSF